METQISNLATAVFCGWLGSIVALAYWIAVVIAGAMIGINKYGNFRKKILTIFISILGLVGGGYLALLTYLPTVTVNSVYSDLQFIFIPVGALFIGFLVGSILYFVD